MARMRPWMVLACGAFALALALLAQPTAAERAGSGIVILDRAPSAVPQPDPTASEDAAAESSGNNDVSENSVVSEATTESSAAGAASEESTSVDPPTEYSENTVTEAERDLNQPERPAAATPAEDSSDSAVMEETAIDTDANVADSENTGTDDNLAEENEGSDDVAVSSNHASHRFAAADDKPKDDKPKDDKPKDDKPKDDKPKDDKSKDSAAGASKDAANQTQSAVYKANKPTFQPPCDITADRGICLFGGQRVLLPAATVKGNIGYWTFDDAHPVDNSRQQLHGVSVLPFGPGFNGVGASANFPGGDKIGLEVPFSKVLEDLDVDAAISFRAYFKVDRDQTEDRDCPIVYLGDKDASVLRVSWNPNRRILSASRLQSNKDAKPADSVRVRFALPRKSWHHIVINFKLDFIEIWINGIPVERSKSPTDTVRPKIAEPAFFAGSTPFSDEKCTVPFLLDELKLYNRHLRNFEVEAESVGALGPVEPSFVRPGCYNCMYADATKSCKDKYRLCRQTDLNAGALLVARKMGWPLPVWVEEPSKDSQINDHNTPKMALCCRMDG